MNLFTARILAFTGVATLVVSCAQVRPVATAKAPASPRSTNSLGMVFVPVPAAGVKFSIYENPRALISPPSPPPHPGLDGTNWNHAFYHGITPVSAGPDSPVVNVRLAGCDRLLRVAD